MYLVTTDYILYLYIVSSLVLLFDNGVFKNQQEELEKETIAAFLIG